jgi:carbonic anhydrase
MVLGHQACGAIHAAIESLTGGVTLPGHLPLLVDGVGPAVRAALKQPGDPLDNAIRENIRQTVAQLKTAEPILGKFVANRKLDIVGAVYDLASGRIELVA